MKIFTVENEYGETIEINYNADGVIKIRHSDINPRAWGTLHEFAKRIRHPGMQKFVDANPAAREVAARMGGYMVIQGKTFMISPQEMSLIHEAVRKGGGIVRNWSSSP